MSSLSLSLSLSLSSSGKRKENKKGREEEKPRFTFILHATTFRTVARFTRFPLERSRLFFQSALHSSPMQISILFPPLSLPLTVFPRHFFLFALSKPARLIFLGAPLVLVTACFVAATSRVSPLERI